MHIALHNRLHARHRLPRAAGQVMRRRSPVSRRVLAEQQFRHTGWIERKPGAMWNAVRAAPRIVVAR